MKTYTLRQLHSIIMIREKATEFLSLASTPNDEDCTQAGNNLLDQQRECNALINQLRRTYGKEPQGAEFIIIENFHEFGIYYEVGIIYEYTPETETEDQEPETEAEIYTFKCEYLPDNWDAEAKQELRDKGHTKYQPAKVVKMKAA